MKKHLGKLIKKMGQHHEIKAEHHETLAQHHRALAEGLSRAAANTHAKIAQQIAELHDEQATREHAMASECESCCEALASTHKAMGMSDGDELEDLPSGFSRIAPDNPTAGLTAIPRNGSQPVLKVNLPESLEKIFAIEGGE